MCPNRDRRLDWTMATLNIAACYGCCRGQISPCARLDSPVSYSLCLCRCVSQLRCWSLHCVSFPIRQQSSTITEQQASSVWLSTLLDRMTFPSLRRSAALFKSNTRGANNFPRFRLPSISKKLSLKFLLDF